MDDNFLNSVSSPFDGYIQLTNAGVFLARVRLVYTAKGSKYRTSKTANVSKGQSKKIIIPEGATVIFYYIEYANALGKWNELKADNLHEPTIICFKTSGSLIKVKCEEVECPESDGNNGGGTDSGSCKPCYKCRCCYRTRFCRKN